MIPLGFLCSFNFYHFRNKRNVLLRFSCFTMYAEKEKMQRMHTRNSSKPASQLKTRYHFSILIPSFLIINRTFSKKWTSRKEWNSWKKSTMSFQRTTNRFCSMYLIELNALYVVFNILLVLSVVFALCIRRVKVDLIAMISTRLPNELDQRIEYKYKAMYLNIHPYALLYANTPAFSIQSSFFSFEDSLLVASPCFSSFSGSFLRCFLISRSLLRSSILAMFSLSMW
jgi:hypothetical protein